MVRPLFRLTAAILSYCASLSCGPTSAPARVDSVALRDSEEALTICRKAMPEQGFTLASVRNLGGGHYILSRDDLSRERPGTAICKTFLGQLDTAYFAPIPLDRLKSDLERDRDAALAICRKAMPSQSLEIEDVYDNRSGNFTVSRRNSRQLSTRRVCKIRSGRLDTTYAEKPSP